MSRQMHHIKFILDNMKGAFFINYSTIVGVVKFSITSTGCNIKY